MHPDEAAEVGLTVASKAEPERRKLPDGVVLTFSVEPNTGIEIMSVAHDRALSKFTEIRYWADGIQVTPSDYERVVATIEASERFDLYDIFTEGVTELREKLGDLVDRYAAAIPGVIQPEDPNGTTDA